MGVCFLPYSLLLLLLCSQGSFKSRANTNIPTAGLSFAISPFPPSGEASVTLQWGGQGSKTHRGAMLLSR